ncbi:MAG: CCA tRNA nucleotidyltransferase [Lachnospiraceae bacterium]|jgi:tRNA nucleotidyltransferase (CCA-adding enzyme)|nr:CCA tRNA nucleotidyltransferase [Lachnospiraceae bacterium]
MRGQQISMPVQVESIIDKLIENGFEAYAVGGCVRDTLLGREPGDWDITTSASPWQVKSIFRRTIDTGIQHGTVTVMIGKNGYEVTTYRIDGEYEDGRHPKKVAFTSELLEDLKRRDFTINAMAYSHKTGIVDAFGGMEDLKQRRIRCVGDAMERFSEDALRILRAIRFSAQLDFFIEEKTYASIMKIAPGIAKVSKERIQAELTKLLQSDHPLKIKMVYETGISRYVSPAFAGLCWQSFQIPAGLSAEKYVRWGALLRLAGPQTAIQVLKDLKLDNDTINRVRVLAEWADKKLIAQEPSLRRAMSKMLPEVWDVLIQLNGCGDEVRRLTDEIRKRGDCLDLRHLAVGGQDLIEAGIRPGKEVGQLLGQLLEQVLECPESNDKKILLELAGRWRESSGCGSC